MFDRITHFLINLSHLAIKEAEKNVKINGKRALIRATSHSGIEAFLEYQKLIEGNRVLNFCRILGLRFTEVNITFSANLNCAILILKWNYFSYL